MKLITEKIQEAILTLSDASIEPSIKEILIRHCEVLKATEKYIICNAFITGYHNGSWNEMESFHKKPMTKESDVEKWFANKYETTKTGTDEIK